MRILLLLFIGLPIIEMWLLISVGSLVGALTTIGLVLLTACMGLSLLRHQGKHTLMSAKQKLQNNELPTREMADGLFFTVGGVLLLTPGFVTDAIGFACLTPGIRTVLIHFVRRFIVSGRFHTSSSRSESNDSRIIEGDFKRHK